MLSLESLHLVGQLKKTNVILTVVSGGQGQKKNTAQELPWRTDRQTERQADR